VVSVVSAGFYESCHIVSRRFFRHWIDKHRRGTFRWVPGNQTSRDTFMTTTHLRLTGFMGSSSIEDTELDYWGPTLIPVSDLPLWVRSRVWCWCGTDVCGVMGHTSLPLCPPSGSTVMSRGFRCTWVRSDSCTPEWPKFGTTVPFQTPVVMTPWTVGRMTTTLLQGSRVE
jgi:hypothetical protein